VAFLKNGFFPNSFSLVAPFFGRKLGGPFPFLGKELEFSPNNFFPQGERVGTPQIFPIGGFGTFGISWTSFPTFKLGLAKGFPWLPGQGPLGPRWVFNFLHPKGGLWKFSFPTWNYLTQVKPPGPPLGPWPCHRTWNQYCQLGVSAGLRPEVF